MSVRRNSYATRLRARRVLLLSAAAAAARAVSFCSSRIIRRGPVCFVSALFETARAFSDRYGKPIRPRALDIYINRAACFFFLFFNLESRGVFGELKDISIRI